MAACDPEPVEPGTTATAEPSVEATVAPTALAGGTFRYGIAAPRSIVPPLVSSDADVAVVDALFDSLTAWDVQGLAVPAAAESWEARAGGREWIFRLRGDATFADGTPVTAEAFRVAWSQSVAEGPFGYLLDDVVGHAPVARGDVGTLSGVRAEDELTVRVLLISPRADFDIVVGHPALGPVNIDQRQADAVEWAQAPSGNGPFALSTPWKGEEFIRAGAWEGWLNGDRAPDSPAEVVFQIGDVDINYLGFIQGRRDLAQVPPDALPLALEDIGAGIGAWNGPGVITGGRPETYVLAMNRSIPPYDNLDVREALSLSVDRVALSSLLEGGNLEPARSLLPPALGEERDTCERCTLNRIGAAERLRGAGVTQLTFAYNAGGGHEAIRNALRQSLSDIGVSLVSNNRGPAPPLPDYQAELDSGQVGLFRIPLVADIPSTLSVVYPLLHSTEIPENGGMNYMQYQNPTVDSLLDQAAQTIDARSRETLVSRAVDIAVNTDQILTPVFSYRHAVAAGGRAVNLRYGPFGLVNLTDLAMEG